MGFSRFPRLNLPSLSFAAAVLVPVGQIGQKENVSPSTSNKSKLNVHTIQDLQGRVERAREAVLRYMAVSGAPGVSVGVSKDGAPVWCEGFGFADVETGVRCTAFSVMRIASISKPITAAVAMRLVERGKLDLDALIHNYISEEDFPKKSFAGKEVEISPRHLLCHTSGVRTYPEVPFPRQNVELMSNKHFVSVAAALQMFKADPLVSEPGKEFNYTTHGYTLLSRVLEKAAGGVPFKSLLDELFTRLGMRHTYIEDEKEKLIAHRTRYYTRSNLHQLTNVREVDNSYKIAGGGMLSCVGDLLLFVNAILHSYQCSPDSGNVFKKALLRRDSILQMWTKNSTNSLPKSWKKDEDYGLVPMQLWLGHADTWGEEIADDEMSEKENGGGFEKRKFWFHSGGAVGTSTCLLVMPEEKEEKEEEGRGNGARQPPRGVCVAILANCQNCPCFSLAIELAGIFSEDAKISQNIS